MIKHSVIIENTRTGLRETRLLEIPDRNFAEGVIIGSAEDCHVRLVAEGVAAHHVRWYAGHHRFLEVLGEDTVVKNSKGEEYRRGDHLRIDRRPFRVGPYVLDFG